MLINLSNHPSRFWEKVQTDAAISEYTEIIDIEFPAIGPLLDNFELNKITADYVNKCLAIIKNHPKQNNAVHIMGELTFCFNVVHQLHKRGICTVASTSRRKVEQKGTAKMVEFNFVKFRKYIAQ